MKNEKVIKHNIRRIFSAIAIILTVILLCLCAKNYASADDLADQTARNDLFDSIIEAGGTYEEAAAAADKLYREQHGLPPVDYNAGNTNPDSEMETVPHKPSTETEKHEHNYVPTVSKEATCSEKGVMTYSCTCGKSYTEDIKKTEHNYIADGRDRGTCVRKAGDIYTCTECGDSYKVEGHYGEHNYVKDAELSQEVTCTKIGIEVKVCSECGDKKESITKAPGHDKLTEQITLAPTCTEKGKKTYICGVCNNNAKIEMLPPTGHVMSETPEIVTAATFTDKGLEHYKCTGCGMVMEEKELPSTLSVFLSGTTGKITVIAVPIVILGIIILVISSSVRKRKRRKEKENEETTHH